MLNFDFHNHTHIIFGKDRIADLAKLVPAAAKVLILVGGESAEKTGTLGEVRLALGARTHSTFSGIEPNPSFETTMKAVQQVRAEGFDFLLAVGGGSVIDAAKFIAAAAFDPARQDKLGNVLAQMTEIEGAMQRAREIQQRGDAAGAWESIQTASLKYPDDSELNRLRADLASGGAATFVRSLHQGDELRQRGDYGAALAWYLDAHRQYPPSEFAQERIDAVSALVLPGSTPAQP